jgi:hypothetical protein
MRPETLYVIATKLVEIVAAFAMISGVGVLFFLTKKLPVGAEPLGVHAVQLIVATMALPLILILSLEGKLDSSAIAALTGVSLGYVLSHIGQLLPRKPTPPE